MNISNISDNSSLDDVFRFQDKIVVGQRTNKNYILKRNIQDGFFDLQFNNSLNISNNSYSLIQKGSDPITSWINIQSFISENQQKKNQKMVRRLQNININDSNIQLTQFGSENSSDDERQLNQINISEKYQQNQNEYNFFDNNELNNDNQQQQLSPMALEAKCKQNNVPTQKKPQSKNQENISKINEDKSTKFRPDQKIIRKISKRAHEITQQKSKKKQEKSTSMKKMKKKIPRDDPQQKIKLFTDYIDIKQFEQSEAYLPLGKIRGTKFPERLRIPPKRFWLGEHNLYEKGKWTGFTLVDDDKGRQIASDIQHKLRRINIKQKNKIHRQII